MRIQVWIKITRRQAEDWQLQANRTLIRSRRDTHTQKKSRLYLGQKACTVPCPSSAFEARLALAHMRSYKSRHNDVSFVQNSSRKAHGPGTAI